MPKILNLTNSIGTDTQYANGLIEVNDVNRLYDLLDVDPDILLKIGKQYLEEKALAIMREFVFPWRDLVINEVLTEEAQKHNIDKSRMYCLLAGEFANSFSKRAEIHVLVGCQQSLLNVLRQTLYPNGIICHDKLIKVIKKDIIIPDAVIFESEEIVFCGYWPPLE